MDTDMVLKQTAEAMAVGGAQQQRAGRAAAAIRQAGGYRWVGIYRVTDGQIANLAWDGPGPPAHPVFPVTQGLTSGAVATGETVVVGDVSTDGRYLTALGDTQSEIIVPVLDPHGAVIGTLDVESTRRGAFGAEDQRTLEHCAAALTPLYGT